MSSISDYHQYLLLGKITNSLNEIEERELQKLFSTDPGASQAYKELLTQLPAKSVERYFDELNYPGFWKNVPDNIRKERIKARRKKIFNTIGAAVIALGIGWGSWSSLNKNKDAEKISSVADKEDKSPVLRLANGETINLATTTGNIKQGELVLQNNGSTLSYSVVNKDMTGINTLTVPTGMDYKINLSDGSEIWLNSMSKLDFPSEFHPDRREISIDGEAYLIVAKNPARPFIVHLPGNIVEVTGTEFNVNTYNQNAISVSLVEGGLNLVSTVSTVKVRPGLQAVVIKDSVSLKMFDAKRVLSWRKGLFYFEKASLEDLSHVLSRWFGVDTQIDNPLLTSKRFSGVLDKNRPLDSFLDNLMAISKIDSYYDKKGILHFR